MTDFVNDLQTATREHSEGMTKSICSIQDSSFNNRDVTHITLGNETNFENSESTSDFE